MQCSRIDQMCHADLLDIPQPLQIRVLNEIKDETRRY